jgi:hypothetical protein
VEKNKVLPENLEVDLWSEVSQQTYGPEPGHTVQSVTGDFIFTNYPIAPVFLTLL